MDKIHTQEGNLIIEKEKLGDIEVIEEEKPKIHTEERNQGVRKLTSVFV